MNVHAPDSAEWLTGVSPDGMRRIIDALYRVHRLIAAITDHETLLTRIMEESKRVARAEACSLLLYDPAEDNLYFRVALGEHGDQDALKDVVRLKLGQGIAGQCAITRTTINVPDVQDDQRFFREADEASQFETRSILAVPLMEHDALIGVVEVINKIGGGGFTEVDARILEMFSAMAAAAIANARLIEENLQAERLAAIGQAVAGLSHHTKNLVTGMSGSVDLIDEGMKSNNFEYLQRSWPIFKRSTNRISNFVEDMLAFSKERQPRRTACAVQTILDESTEAFHDLLARKKVALHIDCEANLPPVSVDNAGVQRAILNLLTNAADAVPREGGQIRISVARHNGELVIIVADNGPGVDPKAGNRIFEPFFSTKGSNGTGLGLAVTQKIVQEHGGTITLETSAMGGAAFRIVLPGAWEESTP